jgi:ABC-type amino acid transport substrate-binding protein
MSGLTILLFAGMASVMPVQASDQIKYVYTTAEPLLEVVVGNTCYPNSFDSLLEEVARLAERKIEIRRLPWKRAQVEVQNADNAGIFPITRNARREDLYVWIAPLFPFRIAYLTLGKKEPISSLEEARKKTIAIKAGSASEFVARKHGLPEKNVVVVSSQDTILKMLKAGRVDGWLVWDLIAHKATHEHAPEEELHFGYSEELGDLYFAASKNLSVGEAEVWRQAFLRAQDMQLVERYLACLRQ